MKYRLPPHANANPSPRQSGAAAIEFAILIVPLMLMLFGVTEFGRAIYQYNTITKTVRDASRYLSTVAPGTGHTEAKNLVVCGTTAGCGTSTLVSGLTTGMVIICDAGNCASTHLSQATGSGTVNLVTVTVTNFAFKSLVNIPIGGVTIGAPNMTYEPIQNTMRQAS